MFQKLLDKPRLKETFRKAAEYIPYVDKALSAVIVVAMGIDFYNGDLGPTDYAFLAAWGAKCLIVACNRRYNQPPAAPALPPPPAPQGKPAS